MLRVFQSVRGLSDDSVTRLDKNEDLALEMRDLTELHIDSFCSSIFACQNLAKNPRYI